MSDEALKPCPFCGGEAHIVSDYISEHDETRWHIWHACDIHEGWFETPWCKTEAEAIAIWNTRAEPNVKQVIHCCDCSKWHHIDTENEVRYGECDEWKRPDSCVVPVTREDGFCYCGKERKNK